MIQIHWIHIQKKYPKLKGKPLPERKIRTFGKQVLEALDYLNLYGIPWLNLHCGNVICEKTNIRLSEIETSFLGHNFRFNSILFANLDKIDPVICMFGLFMYEMTVGYEMDFPDLDDLPKHVDLEAKNVLKAIFKKNRTEKLTLQNLMDMEYFKSIKLFTETQPKEITLNNKETAYLKEVLERSLSDLNPNIKERTTPKQTKKKKSEIEEYDSNTNGYGSLKETTKREQAPPVQIEQSQSVPKNVPPPPPQKLEAPKEVLQPTEERGALLDSIRKGKKLAKTKTVDKSSPLLKTS